MTSEAAMYQAMRREAKERYRNSQKQQQHYRKCLLTKLVPRVRYSCSSLTWETHYRQLNDCERAFYEAQVLKYQIEAGFWMRWLNRYKVRTDGQQRPKDKRPDAGTGSVSPAVEPARPTE